MVNFFNIKRWSTGVGLSYVTNWGMFSMNKEISYNCSKHYLEENLKLLDS